MNEVLRNKMEEKNQDYRSNMDRNDNPSVFSSPSYKAGWLDCIAEINTPQTRYFLAAVESEAAHQRMRWGTSHDAGKTDADWFWLIGYLAGKALHANDPEKRLHHIITTAAACLNWHEAKLGHTDMRPGIEPPKDASNDQGSPAV